MKKLLALLLLVLMLFSVAVGCAEKPNDQPTGESQTNAEETTDPFDDGVPDDLTYDGWTFTITAPWPDDWGIMSYDREETTADDINDAIYRRNRQIEERFDIDIDTLALGTTDSQTSQLQTYIMSNDDLIDLIAVGYYQSGAGLIMNDFIIPWNDVPFINPDKPWWNSNINDTLAILDQRFLIVGDINWFTMPETAVCYFNKVVAEDFRDLVGNPYDTVNKGEWTFDKLYEIASGYSFDIDGDGKWDTKDRYGCIQNTIIGVTGFVYAANYHTVKIEDGEPVLNFFTDEMTDIIDYLRDLCCNDHVSFTETFDFTEDSKGIPMFFENRALYYFDVLMHAANFRNMETDFGIIPYPKYDELQEKYTSYANQWGLACALPITAGDTERTGAIVEAMSALSRKYIVPAYYDRVLTNKIARDYESADMLDIIFDNVIYDYGISFCNDLNFIPAKYFVEHPTAKLASWYASNETRLYDNYIKVYEHVLDLYG
ncbi:MAG: hypothetical protein MJ070_10985 [Lachnospiraceae bacterium]|nr:hypothetical protein [Lachnospiraceae bacterium]